MRDPRVEERLVEIVERLRPLRPRRVLLFGSAARGQHDPLSDLDLIVVADEVPIRFLDRVARAYDLIDPRYALDILVYTPGEYDAMLAEGNTLVESAEREGRVLYERPAA